MSLVSFSPSVPAGCGLRVDCRWSLPAVPEPGNVDAELRVGHLQSVTARRLPDFFELHSRGQTGLDLGPNPGHLPDLRSRLGRGEGLQVSHVRS